MNDDSDLFKDVALATPSNTEVGTKDVIQSKVSVTDIEWNDYVMGHFSEKELFDGRPLCAGLRRVAELLLGKIVSSKPTQVFPPSNTGEEIGRATGVWEVIFEDMSVFSDVADAWEGNTDDTFCVFNTATAATRAEGRALRKALRLKTVAAEEMTTKSIFIATPCYGGMVTQEFTQSLLNFLVSCFQNKINCHIELAGGESLIPRGRNHLVSKFMASDCTHLMFIDADIQFDGNDILKLLHHNLPVVCGAYPTKSLGERYVINLVNSEKIGFFPNTKVTEVADAGTGFMMISRETIEKMKESYPELHYEGDFDGGYQTLTGYSEEEILLMRKNLYSFFDTIHEPNSDHYLSEDYAFCKRWRDIGESIFIDASILLNHIGKYTFKGNVNNIISLDSEEWQAE